MVPPKTLIKMVCDISPAFIATVCDEFPRSTLTEG